MSNSYFQFQQFTVRQERCAMKVGTDGTLLGAWAHGGRTILDIGTGTGLVALMMAQRFPEAEVLAVDIDADAVSQALENVEASPFARRIGVVKGDIRQPETLAYPVGISVRKDASGQPLFDAIVVNPPYFNDSLKSPDRLRTVARHTTTLSYRELMAAAVRLLADDGELSVVIPFDCRQRLQAEAVLAGLSLVRCCAVRTTPGKSPSRYLLAFRRHPAAVEQQECVLETAPGVRSSWYHELTDAFYLPPSK